jgi:hypothetical protein
MNKRLGRVAGILTLVAACCAILLVVPITLFGASPLLSALFVAILIAAFAAAWLADAMYRKSFPNLFQKFEKPRRNHNAPADE